MDERCVKLQAKFRSLTQHQWMNGWMDEWMNGWMNGMPTFKRNSVLWHTNGWMDGWMDGWMNEWLNEWMKEWLNEWINERYVKLQAKFLSLTQHQWMNGWMDEWMNEWTLSQPSSETPFSDTTPHEVPVRVFPLNSTKLLCTHLFPDELLANTGSQVHDLQFRCLQHSVLCELHIRLPLLAFDTHVP